jgi:hypothetical protein
MCLIIGLNVFKSHLSLLHLPNLTIKSMYKLYQNHLLLLH